MRLTPEKDIRRLYDDLAWMWPIISPPEDYVEETELFSKTIKGHSRIEAKTLLHLGCGGGHNDYTFKKHFGLTAVDISEEMLSLARKLNPEVVYHQGDMRTVRLGQRFDAVTILDSVNYMTTEEDLRSAFVTAHEHLKPGGVFLTYIEQIAYKLKQSYTSCSTHSRGDVEITFIENYFDPDTEDTTYEGAFVFLIRRKGALEVEVDRHLCGVFKLETWLDLLANVGFEVKQAKFEHSTFDEGQYHPMLVCPKPRG